MVDSPTSRVMGSLVPCYPPHHKACTVGKRGEGLHLEDVLHPPVHGVQHLGVLLRPLHQSVEGVAPHHELTLDMPQEIVDVKGTQPVPQPVSFLRGKT